MKKCELYTKTQACVNNTHDCLQLMYDSITAKGQRKKLIENPQVKAMLDFYHVDYEE